jgi:DNA-binding Xre family transcriptional regulator
VLIKIKLREMREQYERSHGEHLTYARLAEITGLARATIESIGARQGYNATLDVIDRLCAALECGPSELLERVADEDEGN